VGLGAAELLLGVQRVRGRERRRREKEERKRGKRKREKRNREKEKWRERKRELSAGFAAAVGRARCGVRPVSDEHTEQEKGKGDRTAIGTGVGTADCRNRISGDWELGRKRILD
jgi:hypothetical protein